MQTVSARQASSVPRSPLIARYEMKGPAIITPSRMCLPKPILKSSPRRCVP